VQIPKAKKNTVKPSVFFVLLGSARVKASSKMLVKLTSEVDFSKFSPDPTYPNPQDEKLFSVQCLAKKLTILSHNFEPSQ